LFHSFWRVSSRGIKDISFIRELLFCRFGSIKLGNRCLIRFGVWIIGNRGEGFG
jgi:hypothetical protein